MYRLKKNKENFRQNKHIVEGAEMKVGLLKISEEAPQ